MHVLYISVCEAPNRPVMFPLHIELSIITKVFVELKGANFLHFALFTVANVGPAFLD